MELIIEKMSMLNKWFTNCKVHLNSKKSKLNQNIITELEISKTFKSINCEDCPAFNSLLKREITPSHSKQSVTRQLSVSRSGRFRQRERRRLGIFDNPKLVNDTAKPLTNDN